MGEEADFVGVFGGEKFGAVFCDVWEVLDDKGKTRVGLGDGHADVAV